VFGLISQSRAEKETDFRPNADRSVWTGGFAPLPKSANASSAIGAFLVDRPEADKKKGKQLFAVVNSARALSGTSGPVVSTHSTWTAATRAAKADHHYRVLELRNQRKVSEHVNPMTDVIFDRNGRWG
jgi:hypothetical protein